MCSSVYPSFILHHVTSEVVLKYLLHIRTNACGVDGINSKMLKLCVPYCIFALTHIVNFSISSNVYPIIWKKAHVKPLPKVKNPTEFKDYRPISLLPTLSKILERVVYAQVSTYLTDHDLLNSNQSGFRSKHSTTTALLKISTDIIDSIDRGDATILTLLDYSKAFDTINHNLLLSKLTSLGFMDQSIKWFKSYLNNRCQRVFRNDKLSDWANINNGVPQGSILGPLLFIILSQDISNVIRNSSHHLYADDTQVYTSSTLNTLHNSVTNLNNDLTFIKSWSLNNGLKLNESKCVSMFLASPYNINQIKTLNLSPISISDFSLPSVSQCKNLGVIFDTHMSWEPHINSLISKSYYKLRNLYRFKNFLSSSIKLQLCNSLILSNFNYCDVLFGNISVMLQKKIQRVQNSCLRFCFSLKRRDHISPYLMSSGWLNMCNRRRSHSLTQVYKILHNDCPAYLASPMQRLNVEHNHLTRSANHLPIPHFNRSIKERSFYVAAVREFNGLPQIIKNSTSLNVFKNKIKAFVLSEQWEGLH